jgi:hypothetical protein
LVFFLRIEIFGARIRPEIIGKASALSPFLDGEETARFHRECEPGLCRDGNRGNVRLLHSAGRRK